MKTQKKEYKLCMSCMEEHEVETVLIKETNAFKGKEVEYEAEYEYCEFTEEITANEEMIKKNDVSFKNAYRKSCGLLTSTDIINIRKKYGISQTDLSMLLGLGAKTITRYESSQVQDEAYDVLLRKLDNDPEWFLELLKNAKTKLSKSAYEKYLHRGLEMFFESEDTYKRKSIAALYAQLYNLDDCCGNTQLNLDKLIEVINYFAFSNAVSALYKVKLMKMLWYSDNLSYKRHGNSITGLAYRAYPKGALPIGHESLIELQGISYQEIYFENGVGYKFNQNGDFTPKILSHKDINILDTIILEFGNSTKDEIVDTMHEERAYKETASRDIIQFQYAKDLTLS